MSTSTKPTNSRVALVLSVTLALGALLAWPALQDRQAPETRSMIVQADSLEGAIEAVEAVGGTITHELGVIDAAAARLTDEQLAVLAGTDGIRAYENATAEVAGKPAPETFYPGMVDADRLHADGITGKGVGVAVLDSGSWAHVALNRGASGDWRQIAQYDAIQDVLVASLTLEEMATQKSPGVGTVTDDGNGHGTHIASVAVSSANAGGRVPEYGGVAPDAFLISVKAFDASGMASYADVIRGIDWVVQNKDSYAIRVLNCSFSAPAQSFYWDDPLNQAVMRAWQAGIVVVASAGNKGPEPMTVGVPGNNPYVITVGAMTDRYTPADPTDDRLASFSAAGPTVEGFVKPELVAPGGHLLGLMPAGTTLTVEYPEFHDANTYFTMSGTSQAAAVVSGVVALMLDREPFLSPEEVKCKLMSAARPAVDEGGALAYSVFQQGAGLVNAYDATYSTELACANRGLNVDLDLADVEHYGGRADRDENGAYYLRGLEGSGYTFTDGFVFTDGYVFTDAFVFTDGYVFTDAYMFTDGYTWSDVHSNAFVFTDAYVWSGAYFFTDGMVFTDGLTEPASVNVWVPQE